MSGAPKNSLFAGRTILLGVGGGIAAYKVVGLASTWTQRGTRVRVLMTRAATRFVTPLTFRAVTRQPVVSEIFREGDSTAERPDHIEAGDDADLFLVAPATADLLARAAHGLAADIVSLSLLAHAGPVIFAPAMNDRMWAHPAVRQNVALLRERGARIVEPEVGHLACGSYGAGRLAESERIDRIVAEVLGKAASP